MPQKYITELERGHVRNQAITYFSLALLLMGSIGKKLELTAPSAGFNLYIWPLPIPLPSINLGSWPILIIDLIILGLSLLLMASLFVKSLFRTSVRLSRYLGWLVILLLPMTFLIGAAKGLAVLQDTPHPWFGVFAWASITMVLALEIHLLLEAIQTVVRKVKSKKLSKVKTGQFKLNL